MRRDNVGNPGRTGAGLDDGRQINILTKTTEEGSDILRRVGNFPRRELLPQVVNCTVFIDFVTQVHCNPHFAIDSIHGGSPLVLHH